MNHRSGRTLPVRYIFWPFFLAACLLWACFAECAEPVKRGGILRDMMNRCPAYGLNQIRGFDKATQCHEATHFYNGHLSQQYGQMYGGFYCGNGKSFILPEPNCTIAQVARRVPQRIRNSRHRIYFAADRQARNCLSLIDEWTCYTNDAQCTKELSLPYDGGLEAAQDFATVADCVVAEVKERDPQYSHQEQLEAFVAFQKQRVTKLGGKP